MIKKAINEKNPDVADVILISTPYEKTASFHRGTKNAPKKIIKCFDTQLEFWDRKLKTEAINHVKIAHTALRNINLLKPVKALEKIEKTCSGFVVKNKFIFLLGGEHSVSLGHLKALTEKHKPEEVTILHIDAHCDLRKDDSDYSKKPSNLAHSTVMYNANQLGYPIVQVGIRTYSKSEYEYFSDPANNIKVFEWGTQEIPSIKDIIIAINTRKVYLSIDVDGFDPTFMPGTGTPVQGGLEWWYGLNLIEKLTQEKELIGADIVEVSPMKDSVVTEYGAAQLIYTIIANKFQK